jgi:predicted dehydrogenase
MVTRVGLIGVGAMGTNHARIVHESRRAELFKIYDVNQRAAERAAKTWDTRAARSLDELEECDAIIIATSTSTHFSLAKNFAEKSKAIFVEKPLCSTLNETRDLISICRNQGAPLMCGFVERFNPAVVTALSMVNEPVRHLMTYRHSPFNPRASSSVVKDLLIHDLDLTARIAPNQVLPKVGSSIWSPNADGFSETVDCTLNFDDQMTTLQSASRWGQRKIREIRISTDSLLLEIDLIRATVTAFQHRSQPLTTDGQPVSYRSETLVEIPFVRHAGEPLALQFDHFLALVSGDADAELEADTIELPHILAELVEDQGSANSAEG